MVGVANMFNCVGVVGRVDGDANLFTIVVNGDVFVAFATIAVALVIGGVSVNGAVGVVAFV